MSDMQTPAAEPTRHLEKAQHLQGAFGAGGFGAMAESIARFFGTPQYLVGQTLVVLTWVALNVFHVVHFDLYPFILLNLAFSLQAAYAAPLILLASTRQAARDKAHSEADAHHREELSQHSMQQQELTVTEINGIKQLLEQNTALTEQVHKLSERVEALTQQIHDRVNA